MAGRARRHWPLPWFPWRDAFRIFDGLAARVLAPPARIFEEPHRRMRPMTYLLREDDARPGRFGDPPPPDLRLPPTTLGPVRPPAPPRGSSIATEPLRLPVFATIGGFARHGHVPLGPGSTAAIERLAETIAGGLRTPTPFTAVRLVGYVAGDEGDATLGLRRAQAVQSALLTSLLRRDPAITSRVRFLVDDCGFSPAAPKVDVFLWVGPGGPPPGPCATRLPSPAEAAQAAVRPQTPEQRIDRILREPLPQRGPGRSFSQAFWRGLDEGLERVMGRTGVPSRLRGPIRAGVRKAVERGAEEILDRVLSESGLPGEVREAIKSTVRGALRTPVR